MKVSALQVDIAYKNAKANMQKMELLVEQTVERERPDVIVLPEMWNVSFFPDDIENYADENGEQSKIFLSRTAKTHHVNIVGGSVATSVNGKYYNTSYSYNREGELVHTYNKVHLFSPSNEHQIFTAGDELGVFEIDGIKVGVATCYDLRFVEWIWLMALENIQILFVPAAWPHPRVHVWETLLRARAIENQFFVIGVNSIGKTDSLQFCGHSCILNPLGEALDQAEEEERVIGAELDLDSIAQVRRDIAVYTDRRPELY